MAETNWAQLLGVGLLAGAGVYFFTKTVNAGGNFAVGDRVALKDNIFVSGTIRSVLPQLDGRIWYEVIWDNPDFAFNPVEGKLLTRIT